MACHRPNSRGGVALGTKRGGGEGLFIDSLCFWVFLKYYLSDLIFALGVFEVLPVYS